MSLASLWEACMQVFDVVVTAQRYSWDCEVARVKLDIEHARLAVWGETVGLTDSQRGGCTVASTSAHDARISSQPAPRQHPRLRDPKVANVVRDSLGCMHRLFEKMETLQRRYALRQDTDSSFSASPDVLFPRAWTSIFERRFDSPRDSRMNRRSKENMTTRTRWAVSDKKRFEELLSDIRWFNDSLCKLVTDELVMKNDRLSNTEEDDEVGCQKGPPEDLSSAKERVSMLEDWVSISPDESDSRENLSYWPIPVDENNVRPPKVFIYKH
ncbi:uncharacterized protein SCHCODRAFT_02509916 [Schizophyllum commune H4-8]|nr:uncharacterized protein SCHCODRAFT_02509916 [Schizophyllum commune H4-8]KAI5889830.1 hypothetical protein SCHCODRAFT_02509916 [Schizophyllum commune H4-8]